jgi:hypothetical protein
MVTDRDGRAASQSFSPTLVVRPAAGVRRDLTSHSNSRNHAQRSGDRLPLAIAVPVVLALAGLCWLAIIEIAVRLV